MGIEVRDAPEQHRYEAVGDNGAVAGWAQYLREGDVTTFTHTVVDPAHEGQGVGGALARRALDDVRAAGGTAVPVCRFIRSWIDRHPDYEDLVAS